MTAVFPSATGAGAARDTMDRATVEALRQVEVGPLDKGWPPALWGRTVAEVARAGARLATFPTPLATLDRAALDANLEALAMWTAEHGILLAPHGKTTMAPQLWQEQLDAGAWGITVANLPQLAVARHFGVTQVHVANELVDPVGLRWLAGNLAAHPEVTVMTWADSPAVVDRMTSALAGAEVDPSAYPVDVLVELGGAGGRTGARTVEEGLAVARAVGAAPTLRLAGVAGYEAALAHTSSPADLERVRAYVEELVRLHQQVDAEGLYAGPGHRAEPPVVSAGGSTYPDVVTEVLAPLARRGEATVVLRSGVYLAHDDGLYRDVSPWGRAPRASGRPLRAALHVWARVSSLPEPGLAILDVGRRDVSFDAGMPEVQLLRGTDAQAPPTRVEGMTVRALNDQHAFVDLALSATPLAVGDVLRLGVSHPCTTFDRWRLLPVVDNASAPEPVVVDAVRTYF